MSKQEMQFEEAMKELEYIVEKMEKGDLSLEASMDLFQRGIELSKFCSGYLDKIERKINLVLKCEGGIIDEKPFELKETDM